MRLAAARLYTMICEFAGGTYISQVRADDEHDALNQWASLLQREQPFDLASPVAELVLNGTDGPTALKGVEAVWCWTGLFGEQLILTNIVRSA